MHLFDKLKAIRSDLSSERYRVIWACIFCLFLCSIFVTDNVRMHRNFFYLLVIPLFALQVQASFFAGLLRSPVFLASLAYLFYLWLSLTWASETAPYTYYNEARTLVLMLLFLAITAFYASRLDTFPLLLAKCFAWVVGLSALASLAWFYSGSSFAAWGGLESRAVDIGLAGHPIDSAGVYGFAAVVLIFALFVHAQCRSAWTWLCAGALLSILVFIGLTQTRGAILAVALVLFTGLLCQGGKKLWLSFAVLGAVTLGIILISMHHPEGMVGFERRFAVRIEIWQLALERAWEAPWFGFGVNEHQQLFLASGEYHGVAHNLYLENLLFGGIVATLLLLGLVALALGRAWREYQQDNSFFLPAVILYPLIFAVSAGYLTLSKISPMWVQFWLPVGLIIGADLRSLQRSSRTLSSKHAPGRQGGLADE